jgi:tRNA pseudouridine55 synthase
MDGILLIDKPEGWTSFDVVNYVRKTVARLEDKKPRHVKVGHTGTLDPSATGLLVLCIGKATKLVPTMIKHDKTYDVELTLGMTSTTGDKEGVLSSNVESRRSSIPSLEEIERVIMTFVGEIEQVPPAFSAIKVNGKRAYDLARAGKPVELQPRKVIIHSITAVSYAYPVVHFTASVGSGTYIRSLASDIGEKLGTGAYMSNLRRKNVAEYKIEQAYAISEVDETIEQKILAC